MSYDSAASELIAELRERSGKTQTDVAAALGVTQSTISKIERGEIAAGIAELRRFCEALDVSFVDFVSLLESKYEERHHKC